ncbi:FAD-binding oxidoreductase [Ramlibacter sp. WS9]|uniref:FAD-binding oxidoreductase n=1 Tax=Ramlibacter sp. WS9 TaxID=1882741 RepID=UPI001143FFF4|nr:FAD-linked oxidase C-terminal domain-containing protein [Ramlibacter sp. WS9]ROZ76678.1 FAD-binding protein [Ramlibacter sp. WS9]
MTTVTRQRRTAPAALIQDLKLLLGERLSTAAAVREQHGRDESAFDVPAPDAVVFCETAEEVTRVVTCAAAHRVPVIAFGAGSSLEGHVLATEGGITLDLARMNRILKISQEDMTATVQAGVTREELNRALRAMGLFFPIDPGANATLGGMAATRASGTNAVRYGTMRENVLGLTAVLPDGRVLRTGTRARKSSAGYDLTRLFVGSEGTLGIVTELTVRLYPLPEAVSAAICHMPSVDAAVRTTIQIVQMGIPIARCELLDERAVRAVNKHERMQLREQPMLLMEFHGSDTGVREQAELVQQIAQENGGQDFEWADTPEERTRLWTARHHAYFAGLQTRPGCRCIVTDVCVPISRLADAIGEAIADVEASGVPYYVVGHVGDGNFHMCYLIDGADARERAVVERLATQLAQRAITLEGTCTGEHGIGLHKQDLLIEEAGATGVSLMQAIKAALDPSNIMNPGKIFQLAP